MQHDDVDRNGSETSEAYSFLYCAVCGGGCLIESFFECFELDWLIMNDIQANLIFFAIYFVAIYKEQISWAVYLFLNL